MASSSCPAHSSTSSAGRGLFSLIACAHLERKRGAGWLPMTLSITSFIGQGCNSAAAAPSSNKNSPSAMAPRSPRPQVRSRRRATLRVLLRKAADSLLLEVSSIAAHQRVPVVILHRREQLRLFMVPGDAAKSRSHGRERAVEPRLVKCPATGINASIDNDRRSAHGHLVVKAMILQHQLLHDEINLHAVVVDQVPLGHHEFWSDHGRARSAIAPLEDEAVRTNGVIGISSWRSGPRLERKQAHDDEQERSASHVGPPPAADHNNV